MINAESDQQKLKKTQFWNRFQLIMILVVFTAPILGAFVYKPSGFMNYGDIYNPARKVDNLALVNRSNEEVGLDSFRRHWVLLVPAKGICEKKCQDNIIKIERLRFMQNNDMARIRSVFLHTQLEFNALRELESKHTQVEIFQVALAHFDEWTKVLMIEGLEEQYLERFYIIDPVGNLMMSYPFNADPDFIKKDIKRLLKIG